MKRRKFLKSAAIAGAAAALPVSLAYAAVPSAEARRFVLLRAASDQAGTAFHTLDDAPCIDCATEAVRIRMDGMHVADGGSVLGELSLHAMFDVPNAPRAPFIALHYVAGAPAKNSQRGSFVAGRASMRGFELEYRLVEDTRCNREDCSLTRFHAPLLKPGHYVVAGPRRDGSRVDPSQFVHSGNTSAPLVIARDFDYFAFRVEPMV
jgi:hypothetical protein